MKKVTLRENRALDRRMRVWGRGGGIFLDDGSSPNLVDITVSDNSAGWGGGIFCSNSNPLFDPNDRCSIYLNHADSLGQDLYAVFDSLTQPIHAVLDTFSALNPTEEHAYPLDSFTFDIMNFKMQ